MGILYYYTTAETMRYILTQGDIFATHISYLNDSEEYINGLRELREVFADMRSEGKKGSDIFKKDTYEKALKEIPQIYSISFSKEADLLSQWYMYAGEAGVRLGLLFPEERQEFEIKKKNAKKDDPKKAVVSKLRDVHYFTKMGMPYKNYQNEKERIRAVIKEYADETGMKEDDEANDIRLWKDVAPYIKNYEFRQEKEVRLIFNGGIVDGNPEGELEPVLIEYRNAKGVLIPYIDVYRKEGWPVVEIMVGPGRNQTRVFNSICHFVDHCALKIPTIGQESNMKRFIKGMSFYQVEEDAIDAYCEKIRQAVIGGQGIFTYKDQIYDILKDKNGREREYLARNYYSGCGIIVRKSNAPYEFS